MYYGDMQSCKLFSLFQVSILSANSFITAYMYGPEWRRTDNVLNLIQTEKRAYNSEQWHHVHMLENKEILNKYQIVA
jgi:hypothetical protein